MPRWYRQTKNVFCAKQIDLVEDVDGCQRATHDFMRLDCSKYFSCSFRVTTWCRRTFPFSGKQDFACFFLATGHLAVVQFMRLPFLNLWIIFLMANKWRETGVWAFNFSAIFSCSCVLSLSETACNWWYLAFLILFSLYFSNLFKFPSLNG